MLSWEKHWNQINAVSLPVAHNAQFYFILDYFKN